MSTLNRTISIAAREALNQFTSLLTPLNAFSKDFSSEAVKTGSAVQVPLYENVTATTFNQSYIGTGGTVNTVTVTMDQHRIATVDLTDVQQLNTDVRAEKFGRQLGKGLAKIVLQDIWSVVTSTNFGAVLLTTATTNWSKTQIRGMRKALRANEVDPADCSLIVSEDIYDSLLGDSTLYQANTFGGSEVIRDGFIPKVYGMPIYESTLIPANSITLEGFAAHPDSICIAMRRFDGVVPDGEYEYFDYMADDESGIGMQFRLLYNRLTGKRHFSAETLFGYSKALTLGLKMATGPNA